MNESSAEVGNGLEKQRRLEIRCGSISSVSPSFRDKVIVVTGSGNGIGAATTTLFLKRGARVAALDILKSSLPPENNRLDITCDITSEQSVLSAVKQILEKWGNIDVLANVAGTMDNMARITETDVQTWHRCMAVNVTGPFYLTKKVIAHFLTRPIERRGSIINVCSTASIRGGACGLAYTASKHALLGLSRNTAFMYAKDGIRVNAVVVGGVYTDIIKNSGMKVDPIGYQILTPYHTTMPEFLQPETIAKSVLYLAGAEGVNGAELAVDLGWSTI